MRTRIATTLLALALPLVAQDPASAQVEAVFYKAYYLEKGQRDFAGAMALYQQFLEKAPTHKLAKEAAKQQFRLLDRTGKTKERDAFQAKYKDLIGSLASGGTRPARPERGERPERGGRGERGERGGFGGRSGGMRGMMQLMRADAKVSEMSKEDLEGLKEGLGSAGETIERMRQWMGDDVADKLTKASDDLKKAIDEGKMEEADKALNALKEAFPMGRGRGGEQGGRRRGRGGEQGGRGGEGRGGEGRGGEGRGGAGRGGAGRGGEGRGGERRGGGGGERRGGGGF